jgi:hypothetical protein
MGDPQVIVIVEVNVIYDVALQAIERGVHFELATIEPSQSPTFRSHPQIPVFIFP